MATIIRGHTYASRDFVTAESLDQLVSLAQITGLSTDDLGTALAWSSVHTSPTNPPYGWLTTVYEHPVLSSGPTFVDYHVLIRVPCDAAGTNTSFSDVALFSPHRMETKRMVTWNGTGMPFSAGGPMFIHLPATTGCTLSTLGREARPLPHLGLYLGTASTGATVPFNNHRFVFKGLATGFLKIAGVSNVSIMPHYYSHLTSDNMWSYQAGTQYDPVFLMTMTNALRGDVNLREPVYLFGGPLWRS